MNLHSFMIINFLKTQIISLINNEINDIQNLIPKVNQIVTIK
jgi:hypothetical protein